jgi:hypothetical protein
MDMCVAISPCPYLSAVTTLFAFARN